MDLQYGLTFSEIKPASYPNHVKGVFLTIFVGSITSANLFTVSVNFSSGNPDGGHFIATKNTTTKAGAQTTDLNSTFHPLSYADDFQRQKEKKDLYTQCIQTYTLQRNV